MQSSLRGTRAWSLIIAVALVGVGVATAVPEHTPRALGNHDELHRRLQNGQCPFSCWDPDAQSCVTRDISTNCVMCSLNGVSMKTTRTHCEAAIAVIEQQGDPMAAYNAEQQRKADEKANNKLMLNGGICAAIVLCRICLWFNKKGEKAAADQGSIYEGASSDAPSATQ